MFSRILSVVGLITLGCFGWVSYDSYRGGFFNLPDMPDGSYAISFKNGLRGIVLDVDPEEDLLMNGQFFRRLGLANPSRKYLGVAFDVPSWFQDAWSWCSPPTAQNYEELKSFPADFQQRFSSARFEAVCVIRADGEEIPRGFIFSVPKL